MESSGLSVLSYRRSRPLGRVRRRLRDMRSSPGAPLDLSHSESARLAVEALLERGEEGYREVLAREGEVDFLSSLEKGYILENARRLSLGGDGGLNGAGCEAEGGGGGAEATSSPQSLQADDQSCCPLVSEWENSMLEHSWQTTDFGQPLMDTPSVEVCFQPDRATGMKDLVRGFINRATKVVAIVMDTFSDVEMFCDVVEATRKRGVSVYLLLDLLNLPVFESMCEDLHIGRVHLTNMSVRSVQGETYFSKSGRRFTGQIQERFIIMDGTEVLAGSCSFTWLSWQVHRNPAILFTGSAVQPFLLEFHQLYARSQPVAGLSATGPPQLSPPFLHLQESPPTPSPPTQLREAAPPAQPGPRHPQPGSAGLGSLRPCMAPLGLPWVPQRHTTITRPVVHQRSLYSGSSAAHLPWYLPPHSVRPLAGTEGWVNRYPLLRAGFWFHTSK